MELCIEEVDGVRIMGVQGRIDSSTSKDLEAALNGLIDRGQIRIILDLAGVEYISSMGLRGLLAALKKQKQKKGCLILAGLQPFVRELFEVTGFSRLFSVCANQAEAMKACLENSSGVLNDGAKKV